MTQADKRVGEPQDRPQPVQAVPPAQEVGEPPADEAREAPDQDDEEAGYGYGV
jgi:hypothetical protein